MSKNLKKLFGELKDISMSLEERASLRELLIAKITDAPVRKTNARRQLQQETTYKHFDFLELIKRRMTSMPALILVLIIALSGGVSAAAQNSLPGDTLYPVKIEINEPVRTAFAISTEAKARVHAEFAQERLDEAEKLAAEGRLNIETSTRAHDRFQAQVEAAHRLVDELKSQGNATGAADVASSLEATLKVHESILLKLEDRDKDDHQNLHDLLDTVRQKSDEIINAREEAESDLSATTTASTTVAIQAAVEGKMRAAQNKINEVKAFLDMKQTKLGAPAVAQAQARLAVAASILADGQAKLQAKEFGDAFERFQQALRVAQEAKLLLQARLDLKLDLRLDDEDKAAGSNDHRGPGEEQKRENDRKDRGGQTKLELETHGFPGSSSTASTTKDDGHERGKLEIKFHD